MDTTDIIYNCAQKLDCDARRFEPMSRHTSFKIGGKADVYIKVTNLSQLMKILKECDVCKEKYILLGNGSNVLVPDEGIHGTVLRLDGDFRNISLIDDITIYCGAVRLWEVCVSLLKNADFRDLNLHGEFREQSAVLCL